MFKNWKEAWPWFAKTLSRYNNKSLSFLGNSNMYWLGLMLFEDHGDFLLEITEKYTKSGYDDKAIKDDVLEMVARTGMGVQFIYFAVIVLCFADTKKIYEERGIPEEVFYDTLEDVIFKAEECNKVHPGIWGIDCPDWYPKLLKGTIIRFGRLEYDIGNFCDLAPFTIDGINVVDGVPVVGVHIPSAGKLTAESIDDSYRRIYEYCKSKGHILPDGRLVALCHSWLLYGKNAEMMPSCKGVQLFMDGWTELSSEECENHGDMWRIFGADYQKPIAELPETTTMQREVKAWLMAGNKMGSALSARVIKY